MASNVDTIVNACLFLSSMLATKYNIKILEYWWKYLWEQIWLV